MATEFPIEYQQALDKVIELGSVTSKYQVQGAEFVNAKTVKIPEIVFDGGTADYDRFATEGTVELKYTPYELDKDKQKAFYIDAVEDVDDAHIRTTNAVSEFERMYLIPEIDTYFFTNVSTKAKGKANVALTEVNIKDELHKASVQLLNSGFSTADLYVTPDTKYLLEKAIDRQFAGESAIYDVVGTYDMFNIRPVPDSRMAGHDFMAIADGCVQHVTKRAVTYLFEPGSHTKGDGWLCQMRWVYGNIAQKNKACGLYVNKHKASA